MKKLNFVLLSLLASVIVSCNDNGPDVPSINEDDAKVLIVNEGGYTHGNSSISSISYGGDITNDLFKQINGRALGDVGSAICYANGKYYITLNNSAKIEVVEAATFKSVKSIIDNASGKTISPLYMVNISDKEAIVSDVFSNPMRLDTKEDKITGYLDEVMGIGQMGVYENKLFASSYGKLAVADIPALSSFRTIDVSAFPQCKIVKDYNNKIWVMSKEGLVRINPKTEIIEEYVSFPKDLEVSEWGARLDVSKDGTKLYYTGAFEKRNIVVVLNLKSGIASPIITIGNVKTLYNMAVSPEGHIYVCDAEDYTQKGTIYCFDAIGNLIKSFKAGIMPQYIYFTER